MIAAGTRTRATALRTVEPDQGRMTRGFSRDLGMSKNVTASITFVNSTTKQAQAANGTFTAFVVGDEVLVEGTNLNNGFQTVVAIDTTNQSFLTFSPGCSNEGPISATIRTA
jgi:hypothetical protein